MRITLINGKKLDIKASTIVVQGDTYILKSGESIVSVLNREAVSYIFDPNQHSYY